MKQRNDKNRWRREIKLASTCWLPICWLLCIKSDTNCKNHDLVFIKNRYNRVFQAIFTRKISATASQNGNMHLHIWYNCCTSIHWKYTNRRGIPTDILSYLNKLTSNLQCGPSKPSVRTLDTFILSSENIEENCFSTDISIGVAKEILQSHIRRPKLTSRKVIQKYNYSYSSMERLSRYWRQS